jgi:hypothetical protein
MPLSKPMQLVALRLEPSEKQELQRMAGERHITLSHALREGARLYMQDARRTWPAEKRDAGGRRIA